jgi:hypothetical protein
VARQHHHLRAAVLAARRWRPGPARRATTARARLRSSDRAPFGAPDGAGGSATAAEEPDADTGRQLGNFPHAFSDLALIEAAARIIVPDRLQEFE